VQRTSQRINEQIRISPLLVIDEEGVQLGEITREEALRIADERGLDLVEVAPNTRPPVCRLMDFSKHRYRQSKKRQKQHTLQVKEIRLRPKTDEHDLQVKMRKAREFLEKGHKVLVNLMFRGREMAHVDFAQQNMKAMTEGLADIAKVESPARMAGKRMNLLLAPLRAGPVPQASRDDGPDEDDEGGEE
jgi:translation initiation factor IF-3